MNRFSTVCTLAFLAGVPLYAQEGFRRGDANGSGDVSISDAVQMLGVVAGTGEAPFVDCAGGKLLDAGDANDNEHFTLADPLFLLAMIYQGGALVPEPREECGKDPDDDERGFGATDPGYTLRAARLRTAGLEVEVDIEVSAPGAVKATQFWLRMAPGMRAVSFEPDDGLESVDHGLRVDGEDVLIILAPTVARLRGVLVSGVGFVPLGTLRCELPEPGAHAGVEWLPGKTPADVSLRTSVIDMDFMDHHPVFLSRVPGTVPLRGFRRGSMDGNASIENSDLADLDAFLWEGGAPPTGCDGRSAIDAADVNDNESITIADYMNLRAWLLSGSGSIPPPGTCGEDPDEDTRGFDVEDPDYVVTVGKIKVTPLDAPSGRDVFIPVKVKARLPVTAVQLAVVYDHEALTPFSDDEGGPVAAPGVVRHRQVEPGVLLFSIHARSPDEYIADSQLEFMEVGALQFHLADLAVFPPLSWLPEVPSKSHVFRASVVDVSHGDHHPRLITGEYLFARGNSNSDRDVDISDGKFTLNYLFLGDIAPNCEDAADANNDEVLDLSDAVYTFNHLFLGGPALPEPFPQCGLDDGSIGLLHCEPPLPTDPCFR